MNKPTDPSSADAPETEDERMQKSGSASSDQSFYKNNPIPQKTDEPKSVDKDEQSQQKHAKDGAQASNQGPQKS